MASEEDMVREKIESWTDLAKECPDEGEVGCGESYITKALEKLKRIMAATKGRGNG